MNDQTTAQLRRRTRAHLTAQKKRLLDEVGETLYLLLKHDQRLGAKIFYDDKDFAHAVQIYFMAIENFDINRANQAEEVIAGASLFIDYVQRRYEGSQSRMLTTLRQDVGGSFSSLYKNTLTLRTLLSFNSPDDLVLEPLDLPEQQSSPIYTKVEGNRVVLDSGHPLHPFLRKEGVDETRKYLKKEFAEIGDTLKVSNVDRKYVDAFYKLFQLIDFKDDAGAISFGLHVRMMARLTTKIEDEMSDILAAQIGSTLTHASYFASQYKDWIDFVRNAQSYPGRKDIESHIGEALDSVTELLQNNPETVDERIPDSIRFITTLLTDNSKDRTEAIYAGVRGVENFCIVAIRYAYEQAVDLLKDAGRKARPGLVKIGAGMIILVALGVISHFMPVIKSAPELNWILENLSNFEKIGRILK